MIRVFSFAVILFFVPLFITAQTEVWRVSNTDHFVQGKENDFYLNSSHTLQRISSTGEVLWGTQPIPTLIQVLPSANGVFAISDKPATNDLFWDTIRYVNSLGEVSWINPINGLFIQKSSVTSDGNLLTVTVSPDKNIGRDTLYKITPSGQILLRTPVPLLPVSSIFRYEYYTPKEDEQGNIWLVIVPMERKQKTLRGVTETQGTTTLNIIVFDGTTGSVVKQKFGLDKRTNLYYKYDSKGLAKESHSEYGDLDFGFANGNLFIKANENTSVTLRVGNGGSNATQTESWLWFTFDNKLKLTKSVLKGTGAITDKSAGEKFVGNLGNSLYDFLPDNEGNILLIGTLSKGKTINGTGNFRPDLMLVKYSTIKKKILTKTLVANTEYYLGTGPYNIFTVSNNKLVATAAGTSKLVIFDLNTMQMSSVVSLPERFTSERPIMTSDGTSLYAICLGDNFFLVNYSLTGLFSANAPKTNNAFSEHRVSLSQNYPEPFNPSTEIRYVLPEQMNVRLSVFNVIGQEIGTLVNDVQNAGEHTIHFDGSNLPTGVYIYRIQAGNFTETKRMLLLK